MECFSNSIYCDFHEKKVYHILSSKAVLVNCFFYIGVELSNAFISCASEFSHATDSLAVYNISLFVLYCIQSETIVPETNAYLTKQD